MRLLTEAAGQVLTRDVAADSSRFSPAYQRYRVSRRTERNPGLSSGFAESDADDDLQISPVVLWFRRRFPDINVVNSRRRRDEKGHNISIAEAALSLWLRTVRN